MKKKGSIVEFSSERDREIMERYRMTVSGRRVVDATVYDEIVEMPASRFWVSEPRAAAVVGRMLRGCDFSDMFSERLRMYEEITRRVREIMDSEPGISISSAVFRVVNSEAPRFYISAYTARSIIYRMNRAQRKSAGVGRPS